MSFDRAAGYYDATRGGDEEATARTVALLAAELLPRGRVLEIGVGTGLLALPLYDAGVSVTGIDLSAAMVRRLAGKRGGRPPFPVALADATRLPFPDDCVGGAYVRWVLHLIPAWRDAMAELVRVVTRGGVVLVLIGGSSGHGEQIRRRFCELAGVPAEPPGLDWNDAESLDAAMAGLGCAGRVLGPLRELDTRCLGDYLDAIEAGKYSWTWSIEEDTRHRAAAAIRPWIEQRWGPLDREMRVEHEVVWHGYDVT